LRNTGENFSKTCLPTTSHKAVNGKVTGCSVIQLNIPHLHVWQLSLFHYVACHTGKLVMDRKRISAENTSLIWNTKADVNQS